jgi:peptidoglycan/LPS O-acetylase OafA/YrhL
MEATEELDESAREVVSPSEASLHIRTGARKTRLVLPEKSGGATAPGKYSSSSWALLGFMRWILAFVVLMGHLEWFVPDSVFTRTLWAFGGKAAVVGFFLISGLSVGYSYVERPQGFYTRRLLRIYPLYLPAVLFSQFLVCITHPPLLFPHVTLIPGGIKTALANLVMLQNFVAYPIPYNSPLWSISCEVFYYLLAPVFFRLSRGVLIGLILASMLLFLFPANVLLYGYVVMVYLWAWLIGFLLACDMRRVIGPMLLGVIGGVLVFLSKKITAEPLSVVTYAAALGAIFAAPYLKFPQLLKNLMNWLGNLSYSLYLFQLPLCIFFYCIPHVRNVAILISSVILAAIAIYYVFDNWLKKMVWIPLVNPGSKGNTRRERPFE